MDGLLDDLNRLIANNGLFQIERAVGNCQRCDVTFLIIYTQADFSFVLLPAGNIKALLNPIRVSHVERNTRKN